MNKKGGVLVTFIILIPILILLIGYVIELSTIGYQKKKITSVTKSIIANCIDECKKDDIIILYDKNSIYVENITIENGSYLRIKLDSKISSFMGNIIGKDEYIISIDIKGYKENNQIKYEKGS